MGAIVEALGFDVWRFFWAIVNFLILLVILNKFAYKPVIKMLDDRKNAIEESLSKAEQAKDDAIKLQQDYQTQLMEAKKEAQAIIENATKLGEQVREEIVGNAQTEAKKIIQNAQEEIGREKDKAVAALRDEVANLAVLAAGKVIGKAIAIEDHEKMVKDFVSEVGDFKC